MGSRPIFKLAIFIHDLNKSYRFCLRLQEHLTVCGRYIVADQAQITNSIKRVSFIFVRIRSF